MKFVLKCLFTIKQVSVRGHFPTAFLFPHPYFLMETLWVRGWESITGNQRCPESCVIPYRLKKTEKAKS